MRRVVDRIAAVTHHFVYQAVGVGHGSARIVDELRLHRAPRLGVAIARAGRERPDVQRSVAILAAREFNFRSPRRTHLLRGAIVFRTESFAQTLRATALRDDDRGRDHDDNDHGDDDPSCASMAPSPLRGTSAVAHACYASGRRM
ncbi:hypothetical protein WPS_31770 [Vulcanimicrobium alpinum]|uniref:Uncharacterized protein n=1 Tax=Vulcanimicrobium alpinum TaxID=3016050 RepID=A0AAN2CB65_UNVUL|nr:hypothetical protein [Vulcanimicrobium alpinum]BDE07901.1 hypothetical protein WPS_31770 [Vulcanimicrobium alpinum]